MLFGIFGTLLSPNVMDKIIEYTPEGVCSRRIEVYVDGSRTRKVSFAGGCHGNTQGIAALLEGMEIEEAIRRLEGIDCKGKGTSCPDQLARALRQLSE